MQVLLEQCRQPAACCRLSRALLMAADVALPGFRALQACHCRQWLPGQGATSKHAHLHAVQHGLPVLGQRSAARPQAIEHGLAVVKPKVVVAAQRERVPVGADVLQPHCQSGLHCIEHESWAGIAPGGACWAVCQRQESRWGPAVAKAGWHLPIHNADGLGS